MRKVSKSSRQILADKKIAVLGFGSQGQAQALNLRDSGFNPIVGLPPKSRARKTVRGEGLKVTSPGDAMRSSDIIAVLIPDHKHRELFDKNHPQDLTGKAFIFAHGLSVAFELVELPPVCDIILVAPHGPGVRLRERYLGGESFTAFVAAGQDYTGQARRIAEAYADAIGCDKPNQFESTFREEAVGDIFGEQATLCGGLVGLLESGFDTLMSKGHSPRSAYLECVNQIDLIIDLIKRFGTAGMFERISKTAAFGSLAVKDRLFDNNFREKLNDLYAEIESGEFARSLLAQNGRDFALLASLIDKTANSPLQKAHDSLIDGLNGRLTRPKAQGLKDRRRPDARKGSRDT